MDDKELFNRIDELEKRIMRHSITIENQTRIIKKYEEIHSENIVEILGKNLCDRILERVKIQMPTISTLTNNHLTLKFDNRICGFLLNYSIEGVWGRKEGELNMPMDMRDSAIKYVINKMYDEFEKMEP